MGAEDLFSERTRNGLDQFATIVWNKPNALLNHHESGFDYIDLSGHLPVLRMILGRAVVEKILVRGEYRRALEALEEDTYSNGACVLGQPGIGKTLFLVYLLVERLGQGKQVAVHFSDYYVFFSDTVSVYSIENTGPLESFPYIWALSDSNPTDIRPPRTFYDDPNVRTIQAPSPRKEHWHQWTKHCGAQLYIMDIWSKTEMRYLAALMELDAARMIKLYKQCGGVPRTLLHFFEKSDERIGLWYRGGAKQAVRKCREWLRDTQTLNVSGETSSKYFFCRPWKFWKPEVDREFACAVLATRSIWIILAETLQDCVDTERLEFFNALSQSYETRAAAGYIYESWFRSFFTHENSTVECHWLPDAGHVTSLDGTTTLISSRDKERNIANPPYYWVARRGFPGIDGALVCQNRIVAFQITVSSEHPSPENGLEELRDTLPDNVKHLPCSLVYVGMKESSVKAVANQWVDQVMAQGVQRIGWACLDPVQDGITYKKLIREELSDEDLEEPMEPGGAGSQASPTSELLVIEEEERKQRAAVTKGKAKATVLSSDEEDKAESSKRPPSKRMRKGKK